MRKPTIPHIGGDAEQGFTTPTKSPLEREDGPFPAVVGSPLTLADEDIFAKPLEAPI